MLPNAFSFLKLLMCFMLLKNKKSQLLISLWPSRQYWALKRLWGNFWLPFLNALRDFFSSSPRSLTFTYLSWVSMSFRILIEFYYFLSWIYTFIYFVRSYGGFQWAECLFSTSAGFSFSQAHVAGGLRLCWEWTPSCSMRNFVLCFSVCCLWYSVSFSLSRLNYFRRSGI